MFYSTNTFDCIISLKLCYRLVHCDTGNCLIALLDVDDSVNRITNEVNNSTVTIKQTMIVLFVLSHAVNRLFSQIMSVGSEASSIYKGSPSNSLISSY